MVPVPTLNIAHDSDGVVSLNILNQLDILLCDYILSQTSVDDDRLLEFRKQIQKSHLTFLESRSSCLITDVEERTCDPNGSNPSSKMLVHVPLPSTTHQLSWEWRFDQNGSYRQNRVTTFAVQARW